MLSINLLKHENIWDILAFIYSNIATPDPNPSVFKNWIRVRNKVVGSARFPHGVNPNLPKSLFSWLQGLSKRIRIHIMVRASIRFIIRAFKKLPAGQKRIKNILCIYLVGLKNLYWYLTLIEKDLNKFYWSYIEGPCGSEMKKRGLMSKFEKKQINLQFVIYIKSICGP